MNIVATFQLSGGKGNSLNKVLLTRMIYHTMHVQYVLCPKSLTWLLFHIYMLSSQRKGSEKAKLGFYDLNARILAVKIFALGFFLVFFFFFFFFFVFFFFLLFIYLFIYLE